MENKFIQSSFDDINRLIGEDDFDSVFNYGSICNILPLNVPIENNGTYYIDLNNQSKQVDHNMFCSIFNGSIFNAQDK